MPEDTDTMARMEVESKKPDPSKLSSASAKEKQNEPRTEKEERSGPPRSLNVQPQSQGEIPNETLSSRKTMTRELLEEIQAKWHEERQTELGVFNRMYPAPKRDEFDNDDIGLWHWWSYRAGVFGPLATYAVGGQFSADLEALDRNRLNPELQKLDGVPIFHQRRFDTLNEDVWMFPPFDSFQDCLWAFGGPRQYPDHSAPWSTESTRAFGFAWESSRSNVTGVECNLEPFPGNGEGLIAEELVWEKLNERGGLLNGTASILSEYGSCM